jgi:predicted ATPase/DNA-binding SARP family transcriptional activator
MTVSLGEATSEGVAGRRMQERWHIELLGQLRLRRGDAINRPLERQKSTALLAYLACHPRYPHPRDVLIELLWPEEDPEVGRRKLRSLLHDLRALLAEPHSAAGALLLAERTTVHLDPAAFTTDVAEFQTALQSAAHATELAERIRRLEAAGKLYRGELLPGFLEPWVLSEREHLAATHFEALCQLAAAREQVGDLEGAVAAAREAVSADPLREEAHYHLMRLYAATGQPAATLRQFQELERLLREELGETPSAEARALAEELRQGARSIVVARSTAPPSGESAALPGPPMRGAAPSTRIPDARRHSPFAPSPSPRLPVQLTRFFGRHEEIAWITQTLCYPDVRLVTLTGPGGTGKTRLAVTAAGRLMEPWDGAVWFVPLADVAPPPRPEVGANAPDDEGAGTRDRIAAAIASALGLPPSADESPLGQVVEALGRQATLLVLDNFEHLVEPGALLVRTLLERVPSLSCLVTSRQHLDLVGEQEFAVLPLPTPHVRAGSARVPPPPPRSARGYPAGPRGDAGESALALPRPTLPGIMENASVQLFVDRARAVRPGFQIGENNAAAVAALCDRLEGLPLALELAATWVRSLTPAQILERLSQRFELLVWHRRDVAARHQSLRAAIEWSYQLLSADQRCFFAQLSVFRGGWTLAAAEEVTEEPRALAYLHQLQQCSLVVGEETGEAMRYRLLETLREFAAEQVEPEERRKLARRHAAFFLALAERADAEADGEEGVARLQEVEREYDNLRAALDGCLQSDSSRDAVAITEDIELGLALGAALGAFWLVRGHFTEGRRYLTALLARSEGLVSCTRARALTIAGRLALFQEGSSATVDRLLEEALVIARALDDRPLVASILLFQADQSRVHRAAQECRALCEEALALYRELGDRRGTAVALITLGLICEGEDWRRARAYYEEGTIVLRELGRLQPLAWAYFHLCSACYVVGDYEPAAAAGHESLALFEQFGDRMGIAACHDQQGLIALAQGDLASARRHFETLRDLHLDLGSQPGLTGASIRVGDLELAQGDPEAAATLFTRALQLARETNEVRHVVGALTGLGLSALRQGDAPAARSRFVEALSIDRDRQNPMHALPALEGLAGALTHGAAVDPAHDRPTTATAPPELLCAARLFGAAEAVRGRLGARRAPYEQAEYDTQVATLRASLSDDRFTAAWDAGRTLSWEQMMACALGELL